MHARSIVLLVPLVLGCGEGTVEAPQDVDASQDSSDRDSSFDSPTDTIAVDAIDAIDTSPSDAPVGPTPTLCAAPPKNLIAHGTFEEGMAGLAPKGWEVRNPARPGECSGAPSDHVFLTDAPTSCGGKALAIDSSGGAWDCYAVQIVSDYKTIVAGRTYRISATVRSKGNAVNPAAWFTIGAQWVDKGDAFFGDVKNPKTTEIDYDWKVLSFDVVAPAGAERILIWLSGHYPARVDYDNVSVVEVP